MIATGSSAGNASEPETAAEVSFRLFTSASDQAKVAPGVASASKAKESPVERSVATVREAPPTVRTRFAVEAPSPTHSTEPEKAAVVASLISAEAAWMTGQSFVVAAKRRISVPLPPRPPKHWYHMLPELL